MRYLWLFELTVILPSRRPKNVRICFNDFGAIMAFYIAKMAMFECKHFVFSSSATVYGDPASVLIREDFTLSTTNPYGWSKLMVDSVLCDIYTTDSEWSIGILWYFNPVGAHPSGLIGEDPNGIPNNLMPFVSLVAVGRHEKLSVLGDDYNTRDGTGVRDYIHVVDLAKGHLKALQRLMSAPQCVIVNLGTGRRYSVLDIVSTFEKVSGNPIPYQVSLRRTGDLAQCYADPNYAKVVIGWKADYDIHRMCEDTWRWQFMNLKGYGK